MRMVKYTFGRSLHNPSPFVAAFAANFGTSTTIGSFFSPSFSMHEERHLTHWGEVQQTDRQCVCCVCGTLVPFWGKILPRENIRSIEGRQIAQ